LRRSLTIEWRAPERRSLSALCGGKAAASGVAAITGVRRQSEAATTLWIVRVELLLDKIKAASR